MFNDLLAADAQIAKKVVGDLVVTKNIQRAARALALSNNGYVTRGSVNRSLWPALDSLADAGNIKRGRASNGEVMYSILKCKEGSK